MFSLRLKAFYDIFLGRILRIFCQMLSSRENFIGKTVSSTEGLIICFAGEIHNDRTVGNISPPQLFRRDHSLVWYLLVLLLRLQRTPVFLSDQPSLYLLPADQSLR